MSINAAELIVAVKQVGADNVQLSLLGIGTAVVDAGVKAVTMAADFQTSMTQLVTGAGESRNNLKLVSDGILAMAVQTGTSTQQLSDGMYMIESAGYHGAAGLDVLRAATEGAKVGNADLGVVADGVTTVMKDYASSNVTATEAVNGLIATVASGKTHMQDLASSLSQILPTAAAAHIGLMDVEGAMATMTGEGVPAANAATYLRQTIIALEAPGSKAVATLQSVGLTSKEVADEMQKSLPTALAMITDAVGKKFPEGSQAYVEAIKNIAGGSKTMQGILDLTGQHMNDFSANVANIKKVVEDNQKAVAGWSDVQGTFNQVLAVAQEVVQTLFIKIGTALLPALTQIAQDVMPVVQSFSDWIDKSNLLNDVSKTLTGWIGYIGDAFTKANTAVAPFKETIATFTSGYGTALSQIERTATVIAPLKDSFAQTMNNLTNMSNAVKPVTTNFGGMLNTLEQTGSAVAPLTDSFDRANSVLSKVHTTVQAQPNVWIPFWTEILHVKQQIMAINWGAVWQGIQNIGAAVSKMDWGKVGAFFSNVASNISKMDWGKFSTAFEGAILSLTKVDWGKVGDGASKIFGAMIGVDWNKIGSELPKVIDGLSKVDWGGIGNAFQNVIKLVQAVATIFDWLYTILLGHSIIPDIVNGIAQWFASLPGRVMGTISGFVNTIVSWFQQLETRAMGTINGFIGQVGAAFSGLLGRAYGWGSGLIGNIISGIQGASGGIGNALHGLHIPGFASGIENFGGGLAYVHAGEVLTYLPKGTSVTPASQVAAMGSGGGGSKQPIIINPPPIYMDGRLLTQGMMPYLANQLRYSTGSVGI